MGFWNLFKKSSAQTQPAQTSSDNPYTESAANLIYNLLFCDDLDLYKSNTQPPYSYPFNVLFSEKSTVTQLQKIIDVTNADPRIKALAYNRQLAVGHKPNKKELLAVIVEVGLERGLDVLASFQNGAARYINHTGKILVWETTTDDKANELTNELFAKGLKIADEIGPWGKPRMPHPITGNTRITFLLSDGLYFGEGPTEAFFSDKLAATALATATQLMQYLTEKSREKS